MQEHITSSGTDLSFYVVVINESGRHVDPDGWAANPSSAQLSLLSHPSSIHTGVRNASGDYTFSYSGLSPVFSDGDIARVIVSGAISGIQWSPWIERILIRTKNPTNFQYMSIDSSGRVTTGSSSIDSGVIQSIVASGAATVQSTQVSNAQLGASGALNVYDPPTRAELTSDKNEIIASGITQAGVRAAVGLASANLDTQLDNIPTVTEFNARTLPSGTYSIVSTGDLVTYGQQVINNNYLQYLFASGYNPASKPGSSSGIINSLIDSSARKFSVVALELAPVGSGGGGSGDWTASEKAQIRYVLGLDGSTSVPTASPSGLFRADIRYVNGVAVSGITGTVNANVTELNSVAISGSNGVIWSDVRLINGVPASGAGTVSIDPTEVRSAVGLASANLDTQLGDIPTVSEFNVRTLPSGTYSILTSGDVNSIVQTGVTASLNSYDPPTRAELTSDKNEIISSGITQAGVRAAVGLASANLDTQLDNIPTVTEFNARTLPSGQYSTLTSAEVSSLLSSGVTVNVISSGAFQDIFETYALVEDYPTNGQPGTPAELLYLMKQAFTEFTITGSTITVKKLDGSTTAATYAMDSATSPTSRTRST